MSWDTINKGDFNAESAKQANDAARAKAAELAEADLRAAYKLKDKQERVAAVSAATGAASTTAVGVGRFLAIPGRALRRSNGTNRGYALRPSR